MGENAEDKNTDNVTPLHPEVVASAPAELPKTTAVVRKKPAKAKLRPPDDTNPRLVAYQRWMTDRVPELKQAGMTAGEARKQANEEWRKKREADEVPAVETAPVKAPEAAPVTKPKPKPAAKVPTKATATARGAAKGLRVESLPPEQRAELREAARAELARRQRAKRVLAQRARLDEIGGLLLAIADREDVVIMSYVDPTDDDEPFRVVLGAWRADPKRKGEEVVYALIEATAATYGDALLRAVRALRDKRQSEP